MNKFAIGGEYLDRIIQRYGYSKKLTIEMLVGILTSLDSEKKCEECGGKLRYEGSYDINKGSRFDCEDCCRVHWDYVLRAEDTRCTKCNGYGLSSGLNMGEYPVECPHCKGTGKEPKALVECHCGKGVDCPAYPSGKEPMKEECVLPAYRNLFVSVSQDLQDANEEIEELESKLAMATEALDRADTELQCGKIEEAHQTVRIANKVLSKIQSV